MSSDDDASLLMAAFRKSGNPKSGASTSTSEPPPRRSTPRRSPVLSPPAKKRASIAVENFLSDSSSAGEDAPHAEPPPKVRRLLHIRPKPISNKHEYEYYEPQDEVETIIRESTKQNEIAYKVKLVGGETREVSEIDNHNLVKEGRDGGALAEGEAVAIYAAIKLCIQISASPPSSTHYHFCK